MPIQSDLHATRNTSDLPAFFASHRGRSGLAEHDGGDWRAGEGNASNQRQAVGEAAGFAPGHPRGATDVRRFAADEPAKLLAHPESVQQARALLAEHVGKITLMPVIEQDREQYMAKGAVDFFGEEIVASRVGGAGGRNLPHYI